MVLDGEGKRSDIQQKQILHLTREHASLNRRADRHDLIRIDAFIGLLAEEIFHQLLDRRHAGLTADEHDLVDL